MAESAIGAFGAKALQDLSNAGRCSRFIWQGLAGSFKNLFRARYYQLTWNQMNIIGVRSVPVIMVTGAFVGMTLAIQAYDQLAFMGLEERPRGGREARFPPRRRDRG